MRHDLVADGNGTPSLNLYQPALFYTRKKEMFTLKYLLVAHCTWIYSSRPSCCIAARTRYCPLQKLILLKKKMGYEQSLLDQPKKIIIKTKQNKNKSLNLILISRERGC